MSQSTLSESSAAPGEADRAERIRELYEGHLQDNACKTDRIFGFLFIFQWIIGIIFAISISPYTWVGDARAVHLHVYTAVFLGGVVAGLPIFLIFRQPGAVINRFVVAGAQILFSILFIHLTGGRIETHFHIFGSLAFLAFYRDWRVIALATVMTGGDHLLRGLFWPESVYGVPSATPWRALEHAGWVVFEDVFLLISSRNGLLALRDIAVREVWLQDAVTLAEAASRAKSTFLANMSHELRTPMHGILSYARFGQTKAGTAPIEKIRGYFDEIHGSGERLMGLLNNILDLSKLEAGKLDMTLGSSNLVDAAAAVQAELAAFAAEKGIVITVHGNRLDGVGVFDSEKIIQVLRNLISNGIKFSSSHGIVEVTIGRDASRLRCTVSNRGLGIPESELEAVFDKFVQSSRTRSGAGGTGLGLAICREIVLRHGGRIWAESEPGQETRLQFELPILKVATDMAAA